MGGQRIRVRSLHRRGLLMNDPLLLERVTRREDGKELAVTVTCESSDPLRQAELSEMWAMVDKLPLRQRIVLHDF